MYTPWLGNTAVWVLGAIWQIPLFVCLGERYSNIMCILRRTHVWFYWYWKTLLLVWDWWIGWNKWIHVCVCVCVCVCVWVGGWVSGWVCVCVYTLPPAGFFRLHNICDIREKFWITDLLLWVFLEASDKFLHLYFWIYHISPPKTKTLADCLLERKRYDIMFKSAHYKNRQWRKDTKDKESTLM